jgi:uncharacterized protein
VLDTVGHYSLWLVCFLPYMIILLEEQQDSQVHVNFDTGISAAVSVLVLVWAAFRHRTILPLLTRPVAVRWVVVPVLLSILSYGFASAFLWLMCSLGVEEIMITESYRECGYGPLFVVLMLCVQPAIIEELSFRGIVFNGLGNVLSVRETVIVSSLMFAILHLSAFGLPQLVLGFVLAWLRLRSGSLIPCMLLHFFHNLWCVVGEYIGV